MRNSTGSQRSLERIGEIFSLLQALAITVAAAFRNLLMSIAGSPHSRELHLVKSGND